MVEESEEEEEKEETPKEDGEEVSGGAITVAEKKTERQRKKEKAEKTKVRPHVLMPSFTWVVPLCVGSLSKLIGDTGTEPLLG